MLKYLIYSILIVSLFSCRQSNEKTLPNIIYFLADDLGFGEIGVHGQQKIKTPHIDALADSGMRFTQHYSGSPVCAPARCILLTGKHAGHAYIRGNDEMASRGEVWNFEKMAENPGLEGQRPIPDSVVTIGELLQSAGYTTGVFGKWGLGYPGSEGTPNRQGFDQFYGYNCQRQAHTLYPTHLWKNEQKIPLNNYFVRPHQKLDSLADPFDEHSYKQFQQADYAPQKIHEEALAFIREAKDGPFFLYYASPLPHLPLQAPQTLVEDYRMQFENEQPYLGDAGYFPCRYPRATYAAMISYLDAQLGEVISTLKEHGIYDNTLIIFSSDNGPTYTGGVDFDFFESSKPFSNGYGRTKGFLYEGGIRVPCIASWPASITPGSRSDHISAFYDVLPTFCDIAGVDLPDGLDGISLKATLLNQSQTQHPYLYWEFPAYKGQQAVRRGNWKGIRKNMQDGNLQIEVYDLNNDPKELNNIAEQNPMVVQQIKKIMESEHQTSPLERFKIAALD